MNIREMKQGIFSGSILLISLVLVAPKMEASYQVDLDSFEVGNTNSDELLGMEETPSEYRSMGWPYDDSEEWNCLCNPAFHAHDEQAIDTVMINALTYPQQIGTQAQVYQAKPLVIDQAPQYGDWHSNRHFRYSSQPGPSAAARLLRAYESGQAALDSRRCPPYRATTKQDSTRTGSQPNLVWLTLPYAKQMRIMIDGGMTTEEIVDDLLTDASIALSVNKSQINYFKMVLEFARGRLNQDLSKNGLDEHFSKMLQHLCYIGYFHKG